MRLATAPVSWGIFEIEGFGPQRPYAEVLDEMAHAGYEGTELGPFGYFPTDPEILRAELTRRRLALVAAFVPVSLSEPTRWESDRAHAVRVAEMLRAMGAKTLLLADALTPRRMAIAGRVRPEDGLTETQWEDAVAFLHDLAEAGRARGLRVAFHHHAGTFVETPEEIARLCALTDPNLIGLCLDTGHAVYGGGDPVTLVRTYGSRIEHVHAKDVSPRVLERVRRESLGFTEALREGLFCPLGEGAVDFPTLLRELKALGYRGWIVVEQDVDPTRPDRHPMRDAIRSRIYLCHLMHQLGLTN